MQSAPECYKKREGEYQTVHIVCVPAAYSWTLKWYACVVITISTRAQFCMCSNMTTIQYTYRHSRMQYQEISLLPGILYKCAAWTSKQYPRLWTTDVSKVLCSTMVMRNLSYIYIKWLLQIMYPYSLETAKKQQTYVATSSFWIWDKNSNGNVF